jgi:glycosyltransferase involved in cell wall biosynthesis
MPPKLAYVSILNAADPNVDSGYGYSMRRQLQKSFEVIDLFPLGLPGERLWLPLRAGYRALGRYYHPMREPAVLRALARKIERALDAVRPEIVFAPSSLPLTFVETKLPKVFVTDQVFCDFVGTYIPRPAARFLRLGNAQERRALMSATRLSYPSDWAARSAIDHYGADPAKVVVIPWGGNLPEEIPEHEVRAAIAARAGAPCHLVFVGVNWQRKGGAALVATVDELNRQGIAARATIIGCNPPGLPRDRFAIYPFLDKKQKDDFARFRSILLSAHFFFLPSRADAFPQAFGEAMAFGLPAIGSTVGGIPSIVRDGVTGFVRPADAPAAEFAGLIRDTLASPERYQTMAAAARADYRQRLNWDRFGEQLAATIAALV